MLQGQPPVVELVVTEPVLSGLIVYILRRRHNTCHHNRHRHTHTHTDTHTVHTKSHAISFQHASDASSKMPSSENPQEGKIKSNRRLLPPQYAACEGEREVKKRHGKKETTKNSPKSTSQTHYEKGFEDANATSDPRFLETGQIFSTPACRMMQSPTDTQSLS